MKTTTTSAAAMPGQSALTSAVAGAWETVGQSFDQFCLLAGFSAPGEMMAADVTALAGEAHARDTDKPGYRWGRTCGRLGFHGGKVELERPRVRSKVTGKELVRPVGGRLAKPDGWKKWALSLMLMNVATRKFGRAVRLARPVCRPRPALAFPNRPSPGVSRR